MDPGDVNAQPGPASSPDDVGAVWESPIDGFVAIEGSVRHLMADASWNGVAWRVELTSGMSSTTLSSGDIGGNSTETDTFADGVATGVDLGRIAVALGDQISLVVDAKGAWQGDATALVFHVSQVPEPSSLVLLAFGVAAIVVFRRRRRL